MPNDDKRISLHGHDPEAVLKALLKVDPDAPLPDSDRALIRAWRLFEQDFTDGNMAEFETLLPALLAAGYAQTDGETWGFTPHGIARAEVLAPDDSPEHGAGDQ